MTKDAVPMPEDPLRSAAPFLEVDRVELSYGRLGVLDNLTLELPAGAYGVVLGPSGCGKSTLLRLLAGLLQPSGGSIRIAGADVCRTPPHRRDVAMLFQDDSLYPHWTIGQMLRQVGRQRIARRRSEAGTAGRSFFLSGIWKGRMRSGATGAGRDETDLENALADVIRQTGIQPWLDRRPDAVSGGQLRRAALAKALLAEPRLCLLDEPLSALDGAAADRLIDVLEQLKQTPPAAGRPRSFLHVTHQPQEAMRLADRLFVMGRGRVLQSGPPAEVYRAPQYASVARTLSSTPVNFLDPRRLPAGVPARLARDGDQPDRIQNGTSVEEERRSSQVVLVRPETIRPIGPATGSPPAVDDQDWFLEATIQSIRLIGAHWQWAVMVEHESDPPCRWIMLQATREASEMPQPGDRWRLKVPLEELRLVIDDRADRMIE